jgi:hypothetical protein
MAFDIGLETAGQSQAVPELNVHLEQIADAEWAFPRG